MPKILELARFTSPVKTVTTTNDTKDTPINTIPKRISFAENVRLALHESTQPLTVTELAELLSRKHEKMYDEVTIRNAVNELVAANKITYRTETQQERLLRSSNPALAKRSVLAKLYWSPVEEVPARTVPDAVPGFTLYGSGPVHYKKYTGKYKSKRHERAVAEIELVEVPYETPVAPAKNDMVDYLIEKMVAERVAELTNNAVKELEVARAELKALKEFIKSNL